MGHGAAGSRDRVHGSKQSYNHGGEATRSVHHGFIARVLHTLQAGTQVWDSVRCSGVARICQLGSVLSLQDGQGRCTAAFAQLLLGGIPSCTRARLRGPWMWGRLPACSGGGSGGLCCQRRVQQQQQQRRRRRRRWRGSSRRWSWCHGTGRAKPKAGPCKRASRQWAAPFASGALGSAIQQAVPRELRGRAAPVAAESGYSG
jgi:hypothetical protein